MMNVLYYLCIGMAVAGKLSNLNLDLFVNKTVLLLRAFDYNFAILILYLNKCVI